MRIFNSNKIKVGKELPNGGAKYKSRKAARIATTLAICLLFVAMFAMPVMADAESIINNGFDNLMSIVEAIITAIGTILLLWGLFEWGTAMQSPDGVQQSNAFKRIGGGIVMILAPQLVSLFTS